MSRNPNESDIVTKHSKDDLEIKISANADKFKKELGEVLVAMPPGTEVVDSVESKKEGKFELLRITKHNGNEVYTAYGQIVKVSKLTGNRISYYTNGRFELCQMYFEEIKQVLSGEKKSKNGKSRTKKGVYKNNLG